MKFFKQVGTLRNLYLDVVAQIEAGEGHPYSIREQAIPEFKQYPPRVILNVSRSNLGYFNMRVDSWFGRESVVKTGDEMLYQEVNSGEEGGYELSYWLDQWASEAAPDGAADLAHDVIAGCDDGTAV